MSRLAMIYECQVCGSLVEVCRPGGGGLSCCGTPLKLLAKDGLPTTAADQQLLDLTEIVINGRSSWQLINPGVAAAGGYGHRQAGLGENYSP